ncbi:hypothetical protein MCEGE10_01631 [Flavobacteriaceae bacterium]
MKYCITISTILFCLNSFSQNRINIDNISLVQKDSKSLELLIPKNGLDTGDYNKKKRIAVYENNIVMIKDDKGRKTILSNPISFIEGFCNSNKSDLNSIISINSREYFLEVTYIYPDGSQRIQTKSLVVK